MEPLEAPPELVERTQRITAGSLADQLRTDQPPMLVDVRTPAEFTQRHIDGAITINIPLAR
jgi:rhodanese-related sulfurtransferase